MLALWAAACNYRENICVFVSNNSDFLSSLNFFIRLYFHFAFHSVTTPNTSEIFSFLFQHRTAFWTEFHIFSLNLLINYNRCDNKPSFLKFSNGKIPCLPLVLMTQKISALPTQNKVFLAEQRFLQTGS